jgi:hypothetical protein
MKKDYIKSMIQEALWIAYKQTENKDYERIYNALYDNYNSIAIKGLEVAP